MGRNYFWLNANSNEWSFTSLCPGESEGFGVFNSNGNRRFNPKAYKSVRIGDIALGFQGNPAGKLVTIGRITRIPQDISDLSSEIVFTKLVDLQNGVTKEELKEYGLESIQPLTARSGTFFPLKDGEYLSILEIIKDKNPDLLDSSLFDRKLSLAEKIDTLDVRVAVEYAKEAGTYYLGGKLFEYRNYSTDELKSMLGIKKISFVTGLSSDSSMALINQKNDQFFNWENDNTFYIKYEDEYLNEIPSEPEYEYTLFNQYVHVFSETEDNLFQYRGPARLRIKEAILNAAPDEKYSTWSYHLTIEGTLMNSESIADTFAEAIIKNEDVEKNIPKGLKGYEREAVIKARINQTGFRQSLIRKYGKCCLCGVKSTALLLASHIKPWKDSNEDEKGDENNGLLLCPNHDKLFDRGLISFNDDGTILISGQLSNTDQILMNVRSDMTIHVDVNMKKYLAFHRENCFKK